MTDEAEALIEEVALGLLRCRLNKKTTKDIETAKSAVPHQWGEACEEAKAVIRICMGKAVESVNEHASACTTRGKQHETGACKPESAANEYYTASSILKEQAKRLRAYIPEDI